MIPACGIRYVLECPVPLLWERGKTDKNEKERRLVYFVLIFKKIL
jgi:hypothetical protein